ncbi:MAG: MFS transporter [Actinobacteria bacterium]|nr:MFS transporter [Actinomycetota bacterium]
MGAAGAEPHLEAREAHSEGPGETVPPLKRPEFRKLLAISITVALGFGMVVPVLPLYAQSFGVGLADIGFIQLVFGLTRFAFGLVGGLVVDRYGDRACTMAGLLVVSASSFAAGLAGSFPQLVVARGFGGAGSALFISGLMNRILRLIEPAAMGRATGAFRSSFLVGIGLGPVLGGLAAARFGLAAPFLFYGAGLVVASAIAYVVMSGQRVAGRGQKRSPLDALRAARPLFKDRRYVVALLVTLAGWWTIAGPAQTIGPVFAAEELNLSADLIGLAVTMLAVGEVLALFVTGRASDRYGRKVVIMPSLVTAAAAVAILGQMSASVAWAYFPLMVAIGGAVAALGTASGGLMADAIPAEGSGAAVGVNQMAGDLGYLLAPITIGTLAERTSFSSAYLVAALPAAAALVAASRLRGARDARSLPQP